MGLEGTPCEAWNQRKDLKLGGGGGYKARLRALTQKDLYFGGGVNHYHHIYRLKIPSKLWFGAPGWSWNAVLARNRVYLNMETLW
jgi:hypothetical protein